jgi:alpha-L-rhamnosidase
MTGIMGTKALIRVLIRHGYYDLLYDIIHQKSFPGWGYWVDMEATTLWQTWSTHNSTDQMHAMFGSVDEYNFNTILGISSPSYGKSEIGFKHTFIEPYVDGEVKWAKGYLATPQGPIGVDWKVDGNSLMVKVDVPVNATATLVIPNHYQKITESGNIVWENDQFKSVQGINDIQKKEGKVNIELASGTYQFIGKDQYGSGR